MRNTVFLYFRMILIMLVSLYTVRIVLKVLGVEDYGIYNAVGGVVTTMTFLTTVLSNASQRFFAVELAKGENDGINKVFSSIFAVYIAISVLIIVIVEAGGIWLIANKLTIPEERVGASYIVLHVSLATFIISVLSAPFRALIIAHERMDIYAYVSIYEAVGKLAVVFLLYYTSFDKLIAYALLLLFIAITNNLFYLFFVFKNLKIRINRKVDYNIVKKVAGYSSWTLFGTVAGVANIQGNSILLNIFIGPVANAAFAIANQVSAAVQQLSASFYTAVAPPLTKSYSSGNSEYMNRLFWFSSKAVFSLFFVILLPIYIQTEYILSLWLGEVSPYMVSFVRIMLIYSLILSVSNPITTIVQATGNVKQYHTIVDGFSLLVFPVSYLILKFLHSPELALISMVIIFMIAHLLRLIVLSKTISFSIWSYFKLFVFPCILIIVLCGVMVHYMGLYRYDGPRYLPVIYMALSVLLAGLTSFLILFRKEEKDKLLSYLKLRSHK